MLFCDLVGSTAIAGQLDPEEWREVVQAYQQSAHVVIARFGGHVAQYLGDGLPVYFGWPRAHGDDAERAVRSGIAVHRPGLESLLSGRVAAPLPISVSSTERGGTFAKV